MELAPHQGVVTEPERSRGLIKFYKDCLDVDNHARVVCDASFLKFFVKKQHLNMRLCLSNLLDVDNVQLYTTECVLTQLVSWYHNLKENVIRRQPRIQQLERMCKVSYHDTLHGNEECILMCMKNMLSLQVTESSFSLPPCFLASCDESLYHQVQERNAVPVITVYHGELVVVAPLLIQKNRLKALQRRKCVHLLRNEVHKPLNSQNPVVFFDIKIGKYQAGRVKIELFKDVVPNTAEKFRRLCFETARNGGYKGRKFFKVIKGRMIVAGGGRSCRNRFIDENFTVKHSGTGILSMVPNVRGCEFIITLARFERLDNKNVVFGRIINATGVLVLKKIENVDTGRYNCPTLPCVIADCGEIR